MIGGSSGIEDILEFYQTIQESEIWKSNKYWKIEIMTE